jgi:D-serine deaminase-like pyridoxal phosphate-dependent protein
MKLSLPMPVDVDAIPSPSLLVFEAAVARNLDRMIAIAGAPERLRPHVKTHKMPELVRRAEAAGVRKHKCATLSEAAMIARAGGRDVLISYPLVGPNPSLLADLARAFPEVVFRATVDGVESAAALDAAFDRVGRPLPVLMDLNVGMGRTGVLFGREARELCSFLADLPNLSLDGLHAYDGHLGLPDLAERTEAAHAVEDQVLMLRDQLRSWGFPVPRIVLGGTPTFPIHATLDEPDIELSPGTCLLHDAGYATKFPDLPFEPAAAVLTRVVSRPARGRVCLDLGHKAVAGDPPAGSRVFLPEMPDATFPVHSEEHLVAVSDRADAQAIGAALLAIPTHICPTCALHREAVVIGPDGRVTARWPVAARDRDVVFG